LPIIHGSKHNSITRVVISRGGNLNRRKLLQRKLQKVEQIGVLGALNGIRMRRWYHSETIDLRPLCEGLGVPVFETDFTNSDETILLVKDARAELGLSLGNGYISPRVYGIPKYGMINVHGELLPEYQNAQSVIWPIYHLEMTTGLTIHQIDRSIDTGKILYRDEYPIVFCERLSQTVRRTVEVTQQRTPAAIRYVCDNFENLLKDAKVQENGRKFTTPTIRQFYRMVRNNAVLYERSRRLSSAQTSCREMLEK
jgi:methionyl-tRNA formyltransferase